MDNIEYKDLLTDRARKQFMPISKIPFILLDGGTIMMKAIDGVGSKLKIAQLLGNYSTVGIDAIAMCANDLIRYGLTPIAATDYIAFGKMATNDYDSLISGLINGCSMARCVLTGGETAIMPDIYNGFDFDLVCDIIGTGDKIFEPSTISDGDIMIGIPSSGIHSNGFTLARKILYPYYNNKFKNHTVLEELLIPTRIYTELLNTTNLIGLKTMIHITGGGLYGKLNKTIISPMKPVLTYYPSLPIFDLIQKIGNVETTTMLNTFNMGVGMVMVVDKNYVDKMMTDERFIIGYIKEENDSILYNDRKT